MMFVTRAADKRAEWCPEILQPGDGAWAAVDLLLPAPFFVVDVAQKIDGTLHGCGALYRDIEALVAALQQPGFVVLSLGMMTPIDSPDAFGWRLQPITQIRRRKRIPDAADTPYVFVTQDGKHYCDRGDAIPSDRPETSTVLWTLPPSPVGPLQKQTG